MPGLGELRKKLRIKPGDRVAIVNPPPEWDVPIAAGLDPGHADTVVGFALRAKDLARLRPVYAAARAARTAWVSYPKPGRPGADLQRNWLLRALHQHGVGVLDDLSINDVWSALLLCPARDGNARGC